MVDLGKERREMEKLILECLRILGKYDLTIHAVRAAWSFIATDAACDEDTCGMSNNLVIAVLLDKSSALLPDSEDEQRAILHGAEGLQDALDVLPEVTPLLFTALIGYAVALSESNWGWIPWQQVRNAILDTKEDKGSE